jgi:valyl-tRNA synthetase
VSDALADYKFNEATAALYRFFWSEYCDWYIEASKAALSSSSRRESAPNSNGESQSGLTSAATSPEEQLRANKLAVIDFVLGHTLRLFHPFLPFITEELWHGMGFNHDMPEGQGGKTIMNAPWPKPFSAEEREYFSLDAAADQVATAKYELVTLGRALRRDSKIDAARKVKFVFRPASDLPAAEVEAVRLLLNAEAIELVGSGWQPAKGTPSAANTLGELFLPLAGLVDFSAERARLEKELAKANTEFSKAEAKLGNPSFTQKAPAHVLEEHRQRLADWQSKREQIQKSLEALG